MAVMNAQDPGPFSQLNHDLLWKIVSLNADMELDPASSLDPKLDHLHALNLVRQSSQVCRWWRQVILSSSSIWCRVIDLHLLLPAEEWMKEVLRRSDGGFLHIRLPFTYYRKQWKVPLFGLLRNNWSRIRRLEITLMGAMEIKNQLQEILQRPAPHLEWCKLFLDTTCLFTDNTSTLFSDNAPALRTAFLTQVDLNHRAPWLSQISQLKLSFMGGVLASSDSTWCDLLQSLRNMPNIEFLDVSVSDWNSPQTIAQLSDLRPVTLPQLKEIRIPRSSTMDGVPFLDNIIPARGCSLYWSCTHKASWDRSTVAQVLSRYWKNYFDIHKSTQLSLMINHRRRSFFIKDSSIPDHLGFFEPPFDDPVFYFKLQSRDWTLMGAEGLPILAVLSSTLLSAQFLSVKHLELVFEYARGRNDLSDQDVADLLFKLSSVEVLTATTDSLLFLFSLCKARPDLPLPFPSLRKLQMRNEMPRTGSVLYEERDKKRRSWNHIVQFLSWRRDEGLPIEVFDLQLCDVFQGPYGDMSCLEEISGLKVVGIYQNVSWEYTCGDGSPELLDFTATAAEHDITIRRRHLPVLEGI